MSWNPRFNVVGRFFCSSEGLNPWKHGCSCKRGDEESHAAGLNPGISCCPKRKWENVDVETRMYPHLRVCASCYSDKGKGNAQVFLDIYLQSRYVCVSARRQEKWLQTRMYYKCACASTHLVLKNLEIRDVFPQKHWNAHVDPENIQMARARDSVSSSHHHGARKRVCVKQVFVSFSKLKLKSVAVFLVQTRPTAVLARNASHFKVKKIRTRHAAGKTELARITKQIGNRLQNSTSNK